MRRAKFGKREVPFPLFWINIKLQTYISQPAVFTQTRTYMASKRVAERLRSAVTTSARQEWQRGVVLPSATMRLIRSGKTDVPSNEVHFKVPLNFNKFQIKNYLEELYGVRVLKVNTSIFVGEWRRTPWFHKYKAKDTKKAMVTIDGEFQYPTLAELAKTAGGEVPSCVPQAESS
jgi:ribosomal protein L23